VAGTAGVFGETAGAAKEFLEKRFAGKEVLATILEEVGILTTRRMDGGIVINSLKRIAGG